MNLKISLTVVLSFCLFLAFAGNNNFGSGLWGANDPKPLSKEKLTEIIAENVLKPVRDALEKKDPHMFMTKCYSEVTASIQGVKLENLEKSYYEDDVISGAVELNYCGNYDHICLFTIQLKGSTAEKVEVKESYFSEWNPINTFLKKLSKP